MTRGKGQLGKKEKRACRTPCATERILDLWSVNMQETGQGDSSNTQRHFGSRMGDCCTKLAWCLGYPCRICPYIPSPDHPFVDVQHCCCFGCWGVSPGLGKHHRADGPSTDMLRDLALCFCILLWICVEAVLHQEGREEERGGWIRGGGGVEDS